MFSLLYVDDEQGLLDLGQLFLESDGEFRVTTAISGEAGLRFLAGQDFDAVVSDYQMPEMNGLEFLKRVRRAHGNLPFILFTGRGREEVVIEAINNGVDFYLQKGGDPRAQFAELAHKVRQAVTRRRAEAALSDSEQRLADIINFLPDATFAIDTRGVVIAWNRAMERMTGVTRESVIGKGDYEYSLPFYRERRPLLINLVLADNPEIAARYPFVKREGRTLFSEITIPHFNEGRGAALWFTASPLFNRNGEMVGAIESIREITERKRAEESLNESERRFRELADLLPQGIYEADTSGRMTYVNRLALEMAGYSPEDITAGLNALDVIAPVDRPRAVAVFSQMAGTGKRDQGSAEYTAVRKDGSFFPVSIYSSPIYRDGTITGIRGVIIDITDRKKAEERLVAANREYKNLLDQIQDIYYFADTEGRLVRASRSFATLLGFDDLAECIGRSIADDFYANPADRQQLLEELYLKGKVTGFEVLLKRKDGSSALVEVSSHLSYDPEGHVNGVEGTFHDITARKKAEEELRAAYEQLTANEEELKEQYNELAESEKRIRESEQKYRTVFETTGTAMLMIEEDTTISLVNDEFSRLSGYPREEIENKKRWMEFVVPEDRDRMLAQHSRRRVDPDNTLKQYEFRFLTRSGSIRDILLSIDIIPGTTRSVASLLDITERKKAADEIQAVNEQLVASDEELRAQYDELAFNEKLIRMSEVRLQFMLGFYEYAQKSEKELLEYAIEGAGIVTGSALGYLAFLNDDETELSMYAWSKNAMAECSMITKPIVYKVEKTGLWGEAVRQRRPVITNDYAAPNPAKKGYPEGHPRILRHMNVPVIDNGHIVLVAGVANKAGDYTEHDVNELLLLMQGLWEILRRRRVQEAKTTADEMLRKSEEELRLLKISTDRSSDQIFWLDFAGDILYVNDAACRDYGYSREEFLRMKIFELNPDVNAEIWRLSVEDLRERKTQFITTRHQRRDGSMMDVEIVGVYVNQGDREYSFAYVRDITARRKTETDLKAAYEQVTAAEEELREQYDTLASAEEEISSRKQQLEEIAATVPGVVYQFYARPDGSRGMYFASNRAREVFGLEPDLERFFPEFTARVHPEDRDGFLASIDAAVSQRTDWHFEGRFTKGSGETVWFEGRSTPVAHGDELVFSGVLLDITGRKDMETTIRESEERYRSLVELSPDAVVVHGGGKVLYANPGALRLLGAGSQEEVLGTDVLPFVHPDDRAMALEDFHLLFEEGQTLPLKEERLLRLNGDTITVEITAAPIQFRGGPAAIAVFRDITRRRQAEAALAESERKYRTVFETAEEGIWIIDTGFRTVSANRKMKELLGYTDEEMAGRPVWDFVPPDEAESMKLELSKRSRGIPGRYERRWVKKDGTIIWCLTSATPLFTPEGEFLGSFGMFTDSTERKLMDEALRASEAKYRLLVENIPFGITLIDADHRILMSNTAQGQMFHTDPGLWVGRDCFREFEKRDTVCAHCPGTRAMATGNCHVVETEGVRDDGTRFNARVHAIPLPDAEGKATRFIEVVEDITERKAAEDALRQNEEKYRTLIETTGTGFVIIDQDGRVLDANPEYIRLTGHTRPEEIRGRSVTEWTAEYEQEKNADAVRQCLINGFIRNFEIDYAHGDGTIIPIEINATVLHAKGSVQILTLCRDISERRRSQKALKDSAEENRNILRTARDGFCIVAMDGSFAEVNDAFCRMLGYSREETLALSLPRVEVRESAGDTRRHFQEIITHGEDQFTTQFRRKDGMIIDVEVSVVYSGAPDERFFTFSRDITERKRVEDELMRLKISTDRSSDEVFWLDFDGNILYVNDAACRITGYSREEFRKMKIFELDPDFPPEVWDASVADLREKKTQFITTRHRCRDGRIIDVEIVSVYVNQDDREYSFAYVRDITDRKRTEDALFRSQQMLQIVLDSIPQRVFWKDRNSVYLGCNRPLAGDAGYQDPEDLIGKDDYATTYKATADHYRADDRRVMETGVAKINYEEPQDKPDGSRAWLRTTKVPLRDKDGSIIGVLGTYEDITERKHAEEALRESEEKYRTLVESSFDGIAIHQEGILVYVNRTGARLLGSAEPEVFIGKPAIGIVAPAFREMIALRIQESPEKPLGLIREQFLRIDGTSIDVDVTTTPTSWKGQPATYVTFRDITDQIRVEEALEKRLIEDRRREEALRESEEKYRMLVETTSDFIWEVDAEGYYSYVSPQVYRILGYSPDELIGKTPFDFMPPEEAARIGAEFGRLVAGRLPIAGLENRALKKDGSVVMLETSGIARIAEDGSYLGYRGIDRDITERYLAAERAARISALKQNLLRTAPLEEKLKQITDGIVDIFGADFARVWIAGPGDLCDRGCIHAARKRGTNACRDRSRCLHLVVSSGRYTHTDGGHRRVPFGAYKIGRLATGGETQFITNDVIHDPRVHDHAWAESLGLTSFAGFRLVSPEGDPIGVLAFFSRLPILPEVMGDLADLATTTSQVIQNGIAEQALRESGEWARTILNTAQAGIIIVDADTHRILESNSKALDLIGLSAESVIGSVCHRFICPADKGKCPVTDLNQTVDTSERVLIAADGTRIPVLKTVVPVTLGGRKLLVESFVDITQHKRSESAIREANRKLNLLSSITRHDVANQLTVVHGYTQLAAMKEPDPVVKGFLRKITASVETIQHQIEFTKEYQELGVHAPAWFNIGEVIRHAKPPEIRLRCSCDAWEVFADPMIGRVFYNLFDNALKYGEHVTSITAGCRSREDGLVITFADNGVGIPPDEKEKIFGKGYGKNTGFGLFLVREILAITGMTIRETGAQGKGARFEIRVPKGIYRNKT